MFCKACKAREKTITILADEVDFLRMQLAQRPHSFVPAAPSLNPSQQPLMQEGLPPYVSEEEAEFRQLFADGHISEEEMLSALQAMGFSPASEQGAIDPEWEV